MGPVNGTKFTSEDQFFNQETPGAFMIGEDGRHAFLICPCGCANGGSGFMRLPIYREGDSKPAPNAWVWNGNRDVPTLQPSIRDISGCRFHGFLTDGVWTFCEDSGVKPA